MNKLTALSLLKVAYKPHIATVIITDQTSVISELVSELKKTGLKHNIKGYTKNRILFEQGGSVHCIAKEEPESGLCGLKYSQMIYDGPSSEMNNELWSNIVPILACQSNAVDKRVEEELGQIPEEWGEGYKSRLFFVE
jgi:hypothetical protein